MSDFKKSTLYRSAFELTVYIEQCARKFKRSDRYTVGAELRAMVNELLLEISEFNDFDDSKKPDFCDKLLKHLEKCQIKMALCQELGVFQSYDSWYHAAEMLFDINSQCEKLKNHFEGSRQNQGGIAPQ